MKRIEISNGILEYQEVGAGPVVVFLHGLLVDQRVWSGVAEGLAARGFRCIAPTLPLGSHRLAMAAHADLSPRGVASVVAEFLDRLQLDRVALVGADSGGAIAQLVAAHHPARVTRLILTDCDALDVFPPQGFGYMKWVARIPGLLWLIGQGLYRLAALRRLSIAYGALTDAPLDDGLTRSWMEPAARDRAVRRDVAKFIRGISTRTTLAAAEKLRAFDGSALLVWSQTDRFFPFSLAQRLATYLRDATVRVAPTSNAYAFAQQPLVMIEPIAAWLNGLEGRRNLELAG